MRSRDALQAPSATLGDAGPFPAQAQRARIKAGEVRPYRFHRPAKEIIARIQAQHRRPGARQAAGRRSKLFHALLQGRGHVELHAGDGGRLRLVADLPALALDRLDGPYEVLEHDPSWNHAWRTHATVVPVGDRDKQRLLVVKKLPSGRTRTEDAGDVAYVPLVGKFGWTKNATR